MAFTTRLSLLSRVRKGDGVSWTEFYKTYKPLIMLCGSDCKLTPTENEDLVQQVMCEIFERNILDKYKKDYVQDAYFKYDKSKGHFRHYFRGIVHRQAMKLIQKRNNNPSLDDENSNLKDSIPEDTWNKIWDTEWKKHVFSMAIQELRETVETNTFLAFEMYALQHRDIEEVCDFLDMKPAAVYMAKSRCLENMRKVIIELEEK